MSRLTRGSLAQMDPVVTNDLWKRVTPADWAYWNGTTWTTIAATLTRIAAEDMSIAAPATVRVAGQVLSHNKSTPFQFIVGAGWTGVTGSPAYPEDDFIYTGTAWLRLMYTPLPSSVGPI